MHIRFVFTAFALLPTLLTGFTAKGELTLRQVELADRSAVLKAIKRVAYFQIKAFDGHAPTGWKTGTFFSGVTAAYEATGDTNFLNYAMDWGESSGWRIPAHPLHADQLCTGQTYLDLYFAKHDGAMIADLRRQIESLFCREAITNSELPNSIWTEKTRSFTGRNLWWWCDALYMAPPVLARMSSATGDPKYRELLHKLYWDAADFLYDKDEHLFYRDESQFKARTPNGKKVFWGRGNGWVYAGLIRTLDYLPPEDPQRAKYIALFREMTQSIVQYQQPDGLWRSSLNDPTWYPSPETSSTSFFCYSLLAGINRGYLDRQTYLPLALRAWDGLLGCVNDGGRLGYAQMVAGGPRPVRPEDFIDYTQGAFLLAGSELYKLNLAVADAQAVNTPPGMTLPANSQTNQTFEPEGVSAAPATACRFVPERLDDFAWENDLVAFRAYGPAIRSARGVEDSGIDCWLKRVRYPIVDRWYAGDHNGLSYHVDRGEGYDPYHVGASRGCGGISIWQNGKMISSGPFVAWRIISSEAEKSIFELDYKYHFDGRDILETKRITIELGQQLFHVHARFTENGQPARLDLAIGITTHNGRADVTMDAKKGWMACWEKIDGYGLGTGVVMAPNRIKNIQELKSLKPDTGHALMLTQTDLEGGIDYFAGYGWEKAGVIKNLVEWQSYLCSHPYF